MIQTGLDRVLADPAVLDDRVYGLLSHSAAVTVDLQPAHLALAAAGVPAAALFGPEHGFHAVEQDMVPSEDSVDPWTGIPIRSLYGSTEASLRPDAAAFEGLDLLLIDLQDVGSRYYTFAATAAWAAHAAVVAGTEVWVLDRPNPLGGEEIEGNVRRTGFESFVGAFEIPVRHGLTIGELVELEARRRGIEGIRVWRMAGWTRDMLWSGTGRTWIAPSPNIPTVTAAQVYPGTCLIEGTLFSEGRGTTRPFQLVGEPSCEPLALAERMEAIGLEGVRFLPTYFRPQFHKHAGEVCGGVEIVITDLSTFRPYRCGVELVAAAFELCGDRLAWRDEAYEFVTDRPAIDLLSGDDALRVGLDSQAGPARWIASWERDEKRFRRERAEFLLYPDVRAGG